MNPTLEAIVDATVPSDPDHQACIAQIEPVIRGLMQQGIGAGTIIAALAQLTVVTVDRERTH